MGLQNQKSDLTNQNSWWNEGGLWEDFDLLKVKNSNLNYRPKIFSPQDLISNPVLTLRGPRRAGKTVALKLFIAELIEREDWDPKNILWYSADTVRRPQDLETIFIEFVEKFNPRLICIDEVTAVPHWQRVVKKLRDTNVFGNKSVILTGSSAHDLKIGAERMAGRRGILENPDRVLLPMDYVSFKNQVKSYVTEETSIFASYLQCGGFPFRVSDFITCASKGLTYDPANQMQVFDDVFFYEINRRRLDRNTALEILGRLSVIGSQACSYDGFIKPLAMAKETAQRYLNALGDAFLLSTIYSFDYGRRRVAPKKDKKFLWIDPSLSQLAPWTSQGSQLSTDTLCEIAVNKSLLITNERRLFEGLSAPRNVFTWKSSSGKEIDFLVVNLKEKTFLPVEVKYQNNVSDWDFQTMERAFGCGIIVTKNQNLTRQKSRGIPIELYLES